MERSIRYITEKLLSKYRCATISSVRKINSNENNILTSIYKSIEPLNCSLNEFLWKNLEKWPQKTLAVCGVTGRNYTFSQAHGMSMSFAASLRTKLKLQSDEVVAIILPNVPEYPAIMMGILQAGCIASTMNPMYTPDELKTLLLMVNCKAIVTSKLFHANISTAIKSLRRDIPIIAIENEDLPEGTIKLSEFAHPKVNTECLKSVKRSSQDVAIIPFSSGTTGLPKGVVLTHGNIVAVNQMISYPNIVSVKETTESHQCVLPAVLPFFHIFGLVALMTNQIYTGSKMVTLPTFKPELFLKILIEQKATSLFLVPPIAVFLGKHPLVKPQHLSTLHSIVCGAAALSEADALAILDKNKNMTIRQGFGMTETCGALSIGHNKDTNHAAVGHIMPDCEVKIADLNTGKALGPGQEGELWFRGPLVMREYLNNDAANREVFTDDGWFKTGDIGKYDENKYLYITDRLKELIKVKGYQVPPAELEALLRTHPKILDCAVIGVPDSVSGEVPKALVVPQLGQKLEEDEIKEYVNSKVVSYKNIQAVQIVDSIPKSPAGKILRKDLKQMYC